MVWEGAKKHQKSMKFGVLVAAFLELGLRVWKIAGAQLQYAWVYNYDHFWELASLTSNYTKSIKNPCLAACPPW